MRRSASLLIVVAACSAWGSAAVAAPGQGGEETPLFDAGRTTLYAQSELQRGYDPATKTTGFDAAVLAQYVRAGKFNPTTVMARARSLHDDGVASALRTFLGDANRRYRGSVVIMGTGNAQLRCTDTYRRTATLAYRLAKDGFLIITGGGSGMMEAASLGAYLADADESALPIALDLLRAGARPGEDPSRCVYVDPIAYTEAARAVLARFPKGHESLGIHTWFYGGEATNLFATRVAKFFAKGLREEMLVSAPTQAIVFTSNSPGTREEIALAATEDAYGLYCKVIGQVFLGEKEFGDSGVYAFAYRFAEPAPPPILGFRSSLLLTDKAEVAVRFIETVAPRKVSDLDGACAVVP